MIRGSVSKGWLHQEGGFTFGNEYYFDPEFRHERDEQIEDFLAGRFSDTPLYNMESNLVQPEFLSPGTRYVGAIQPNLILGRLLGCEYVFPENADSDISGKPWADLLSSPSPELKDVLPSPDALSRHRHIQKFSEQLDRLMQGPDRDSLVPPFFWDRSGRATIHGFITTSFKFAGEQIFITAFEKPDVVEVLHAWLLNAYTELIKHFAKKAALPVTGIHIGECTGAMISPGQFEHLVLPYVNAMGNTFGNVRFHTCGNSDHLLEKISRIEKLCSIDTGSDTSVRKIRSVLGMDLLIETAPPMELMITGSPPETIRDWLRKTAGENMGGPLRIGYHLEPGYDLENIFALHDEGISLGLAEPGRPGLFDLAP